VEPDAIYLMVSMLTTRGARKNSTPLLSQQVSWAGWHYCSRPYRPVHVAPPLVGLPKVWAIC
jgi:hypothetical protein